MLRTKKNLKTDQEGWPQRQHRRTPLKGKPQYPLRLCYVFNLKYWLLSTNYARKLVYELGTICPKSASTSSRTITQQDTVTNTANHITRLPTATLSNDQSNHSPGFLNYELTKRLSLDFEDGFRTGWWKVNRKQQSFLRRQSPTADDLVLTLSLEPQPSITPWLLNWSEGFLALTSLSAADLSFR